MQTNMALTQWVHAQPKTGRHGEQGIIDIDFFEPTIFGRVIKTNEQMDRNF